MQIDTTTVILLILLKSYKSISDWQKFLSKVKLAIKTYPTNDFYLNVSFSATQLGTLISESICNGKNKKVLATTKFEHIGGISPFYNNFQIHYLNLEEIICKDNLLKIKPDVI